MVIDLAVASLPIVIAPVPEVTATGPLEAAIAIPAVPELIDTPPAAFEAVMLIAVVAASVEVIAVDKTEFIFIPPAKALRLIAFAEVEPVAVADIPPAVELRANELTPVPCNTFNSKVSEVPPLVVRLIAPGALSVLVREIADESVRSNGPLSVTVPVTSRLPSTVKFPEERVRFPLSIVTFPDCTSKTVPAPPVIVTVLNVPPEVPPRVDQVADPAIIEVRI
jgi:hypothetical protein